MHKTIPSVIAFLVFSAASFGQNKIQISGQVTDDENQAIIGVAVLETVSNSGAFTDENGNYVLDITSFRDSATIYFEMENFQTEKRVVYGTSILNVKLVNDVNKLNEVLVVGYGSASKKELTGATTQVGKENI